MKLHPALDETIHGTAEALRAGRRTSLSVVEQCLARIDERESSLRAWVSVDRDGALRQARECDRQRAAGATCGPRVGIPLGIKDIIDVAGTATAAGSELLARTVVESDATAVVRLGAAG